MRCAAALSDLQGWAMWEDKADNRAQEVSDTGGRVDTDRQAPWRFLLVMCPRGNHNNLD
jgi:hypothetical protein